MRDDRPRLMAEQAARRLWENATRPKSDRSGRSVEEVCAAWCAYVPTYYRSKDGTPTSEASNAVLAVRLFRELYGARVMSELQHSDMLCLRDAFVRSGLARTTINKHLGIVRRMIAWALDEGFVSATVKSELTQVKNLKKNRSNAPEPKPVTSVSDLDVERTVSALTPNTADMVRVQRLTGMRPAEICALTWDEIDTTCTPWVYVPGHHKNEWRGQPRVILIGAKAREILNRHREGVRPFSPVRSITEYFTHIRGGAEPSYPVGMARRPGEKWDAKAYTKAIHAGCRRAGVKEWSANQLRHSFATEVRRKFGIVMAGVLLGHSNGMRVTDIYSHEAAVDEIVRVGGEAIEAIG